MQGRATLPEVLLPDAASDDSGGTLLLPLPFLGGRHGLLNIGNTCFLNAALQPLLHTQPLMHLLTSLPALVPVAASAASPQQKQVAEEFTAIARRVWARDVEGVVRQLTPKVTTAVLLCFSRQSAQAPCSRDATLTPARLFKAIGEVCSHL